MKKIIAALAMFSLVGNIGAYAAAPSAYNSQLHFAVITNNDVHIGNTMYIEGSIYSNGKIYAETGAGNKVEGIFVSGTGDTTYESNGESRVSQGYIQTGDANYYSTTVEYNGAIYDDNTSFNYEYNGFEVPRVENYIGKDTMSVYYNDVWNWSTDRGSYSEPGPDCPKTVTADTHYGYVSMNGTQDNWRGLDAALITDTTENDVTIIIDHLDAVNPTFKNVGPHTANIYINNASNIDNLTVFGDNVNLYFSGENLSFGADNIYANIYCSAKSVSINGSSKIIGNVTGNVDEFILTGGATEVTGIVNFPSANSSVVDSSTLYGQIITNELIINGAGRIIYEKDALIPTVDLPEGSEIDLSGINYAYIFGYEPQIKEVDGQIVATIYMAPNDSVTREQVAAMTMRMVDQKFDTMDIKYPVTNEIAKHTGTWYERGLAFLASKKAFDTEVECGPITRGEVAKLIAFGLNLSKSEETPFEDIENNQYKSYIEILYAYGYMNGVSENEFEPNRLMTRAEFCSMFNNIISRSDKELFTENGEKVTQETYSIVDLAGHWAEEVMLKATSVYDDNGFIDIGARENKIRNILDNFNGQIKY